MANLRGVDKLKKILINDKHFSPVRLNEVIKSGIYKVLGDFMEIEPQDILTNLSLEEDGDYVLRCKVRCKRLKIMGILPDEN